MELASIPFTMKRYANVGAAMQGDGKVDICAVFLILQRN